MKHERLTTSGKLFNVLILMAAVNGLAHAFDGRILDQDGKPLGGAVVYDLSRQAMSIYNNEPGKTGHVGRCLSDRRGRFNLSVEAQTGYVLARDMEDRFGLFAITPSQADLTIQSPGTLSGELWSGPKPLAQIEITATLLSDCRTLHYWMKTDTNGAGQFQFRNMIPGSYVIQTIEEVPQVGCCFNRVATRQKRVDVLSDQTTHARLGGTDLPYLAGTLLSTEEKPLHGVWVYLTPLSTSLGGEPAVYADVTNPSGQYAIHDIQPGTYQLHLYRRLARESGSRVLDKAMTVTIDQASGSKRTAHLQDFKIDLSPFMPLSYGQRAPSFKATLLGGTSFDLADQLGKPVVLHFYATYCSACVQSFDFFESLQDRLKDQAVVLGISIDQDRQTCEQFIRQRKVRHPQIFDGPYADSRLARQYHLVNIPTTFIIDTKGMISQIDLFGPTLEKYIREKCLAPNTD
ncbi:MAG: redoxin domain-containing protein [Phycisphaerae bacterium]|nr:redoxin domain-containing protein [Phycisphaerae bacterium]